MSARNKLVITLPSDREIAMTRDFDAPRALVWEMFTRPEHIKQWWGYGRVEVIVCDVDFRVGGTYRFVGRTPDGNEVPFTGTHQEIVPCERIVATEIFDVPGAREHPGLLTTTFTEHAGKTTVNWLIAYDTQQTRDMVIASGMEKGAAEGYDQIDRMLAAIRLDDRVSR